MQQPEPYVCVTREQDGVLTLVRVPGAVAVSRSLVAVVDNLLDSLGAPARRDARGDRRDEPGTMST